MSRVQIRVYISYKSLGQPGFYSLTWAHKVHFPCSGVSSNLKKKSINHILGVPIIIFYSDLLESIYLKCYHKKLFFTILRLMFWHVTFAIHDRGISLCEYAAEGLAFGNSVYWIQFDEEFSRKVSSLLMFQVLGLYLI